MNILKFLPEKCVWFLSVVANGKKDKEPSFRAKAARRTAGLDQLDFDLRCKEGLMRRTTKLGADEAQ
jgi:hypothetical protein